MTKEFILDPASIDTASSDITSFLMANKADRQQTLKLRLIVEDYLLRIYEEKPGISIIMTAKKRFGAFSIEISYKGDAFDPTPVPDEENTLTALLLDRIQLQPAWTYHNGINRVHFRLATGTSRSSLTYILLAIAGAVILGALGGFIPDSVRTELDLVLISPIVNAFLGLLKTFAGVMVLLTILAGIAGIGDAASLGRIGKVVFPKYLIGVLLGSILAVLCASLMFHPPVSAAGGGQSQLQEISEMLFGILPSDPITPFQQGNVLQIIVIAILAGVVILSMGAQGKRIGDSINDLAVLVQNILSVICKLIPVFVFFSLLRLIWGGSASLILQLWKPLVVLAAADVLFTVGLLVIACIRTKASPLVIIRKVLPTMIEALSTGSCMAAYPGAVKKCREELGMDQRLLDFGFPIGIVMYMPSISITFSVLIIYLAELYGISVNIGWYLMGVLTCTLLAYALPPIPGASLTCYSILLAQMGLPLEGLALAATLDVLADRIAAGFIMVHLMIDLIPDAKKLNMLDPAALQQ